MSSEAIYEAMDRINNDLLIQFDEITRHGFAQYHEIPAELRFDLSPRAQAACIYDFMMMESERRFESRSDIRPLALRSSALISPSAVTFFTCAQTCFG